MEALARRTRLLTPLLAHDSCWQKSTMTLDRIEMIRQLLALAEQHVAEGEMTLARQREVLSAASRQDIVEAKKILKSSE